MEDWNLNPAVGNVQHDEIPPVAPAPPPEGSGEQHLSPEAAPPPVPEPWAVLPSPTPAAFPEPWQEVKATEPTPPPPLSDPVSAQAPVVEWEAPSLPHAAAAEPSGGPASSPPEKKTPLLKREVRLGRKRADRSGKALAKKPEASAPERDASAKRPLLKREIRLGRASGTAKQAPSGATRGRTGARVGGGSKKRLVGLTIGSAQLAAAEVVNNGHAEVLKLAQRPLERGMVVGGELRDVDTLARELKAFFRENRLPQRGVRLGIASNRIGVRIIDVDGIEGGKQLENAVRFRAQEALPIPIDQAVLDYRVLEEREEGDILSRRILLVVAYRESVDRYVAACNAAGIKLAGIDLEAFGLLRALGKPNGATAADAETADVVVGLGHDRSILAVSAHGVCEFTRVFEWGGFALDVAVSRELDLTPSAAEPTRRAIGVSGALVPGGLNPEQAATARAAVQRQLHGFARELVSSLQFYQDQPNSLGFGEIVLAGGLAQTAGIDHELQRLIGVPVRIGNPLELAKHGRRVATHEDLPALAGAIGLGMEV